VEIIPAFLDKVRVSDRVEDLFAKCLAVLLKIGKILAERNSGVLFSFLGKVNKITFKNMSLVGLITDLVCIEQICDGIQGIIKSSRFLHYSIFKRIASLLPNLSHIFKTGKNQKASFIRDTAHVAFKFLFHCIILSAKDLSSNIELLQQSLRGIHIFLKSDLSYLDSSNLLALLTTLYNTINELRETSLKGVYVGSESSSSNEGLTLSACSGRVQLYFLKIVQDIYRGSEVIDDPRILSSLEAFSSTLIPLSYSESLKPKPISGFHLGTLILYSNVAEVRVESSLTLLKVIERSFISKWKSFAKNENLKKETHFDSSFVRSKEASRAIIMMCLNILMNETERYSDIAPVVVGIISNFSVISSGMLSDSSLTLIFCILFFFTKKNGIKYPIMFPLISNLVKSFVSCDLRIPFLLETPIDIETFKGSFGSESHFYEKLAKYFSFLPEVQNWILIDQIDVVCSREQMDQQIVHFLLNLFKIGSKFSLRMLIKVFERVTLLSNVELFASFLKTFESVNRVLFDHEKISEVSSAINDMPSYLTLFQNIISHYGVYESIEGVAVHFASAICCVPVKIWSEKYRMANSLLEISSKLSKKESVEYCLLTCRIYQKLLLTQIHSEEDAYPMISFICARFIKDTEPNLSLRMKSSMILSNLFNENQFEYIAGYSKSMNCIVTSLIQALDDKLESEKVKVNLFRSLGCVCSWISIDRSLWKIIITSINLVLLDSFEGYSVESSMRLKWNACNVVGRILGNQDAAYLYTSKSEIRAEVDVCYKSLIDLLNCENWKVRMNSAIALGSGLDLSIYGSSFSLVLEAVLRTLVDLRTLGSGSMSKNVHQYHNSLLKHLANTAEHLLSLGDNRNEIFSILLDRFQDLPIVKNFLFHRDLRS
jgi:hypothetical protein